MNLPNAIFELFVRLQYISTELLNSLCKLLFHSVDVAWRVAACVVTVLESSWLAQVKLDPVGKGLWVQTKGYASNAKIARLNRKPGGTLHTLFSVDANTPTLKFVAYACLPSQV